MNVAAIKKAACRTGHAYFLDACFDPAIIGLQDDVEYGRLVPVYDVEHCMSIIKTAHTCSDYEAYNALQRVRHAIPIGVNPPIFITVLREVTATSISDSIREAICDEHKQDESITTRIRANERTTSN